MQICIINGQQTSHCIDIELFTGGISFAVSVSMTNPVLILQQVEYEPASLIEEVLNDAGIETMILFTQTDPIPIAMRNFSGLIVMGGLMSGNDTHLNYIDKQLKLLEWCIKWNFPVLGVCLGAQLLAKAAGAEIYSSPIKEIGWYPLHPTFMVHEDPLFKDLLPTGIHVLQWHGETYSLPYEARLLATCPDVLGQAFRIGSCQYGLQFHTEMTSALIEEWLEHGESEKEFLGEQGIKQLLKESAIHLPVARSFCRTMINAWIRLLKQ